MIDPPKGRGALVGLVSLIFLAFIALGLPDGLLGVAWPSIRSDFSRPLDSLGLLLMTGTGGYLLSSFASGMLVSRFNVGGILATSCALTGFSLIAFTLVPSWWMLVVLGVFLGLGAGAIDAGLNTYVAAHFHEGLMQWLHASYGVGVTIGPLLMTFGLSTHSTWRWGYMAVGIAQVALALAFLPSLPLWRDPHGSLDRSETKAVGARVPYLTTLRNPSVLLGILIFFLYTGAEATLGLWTYSLLTESRGVSPRLAGLWTGSYWALFTLGRVAAGLYTRRIAGDRLVRWSLSLALAGAVLLWWNPFPLAGLFAVGLAGLAIAPVFPALVSGTSARVGEADTANAIGMQVSAGGLGIALIPAGAGVLARRTSLEAIPVLLMLLFASLLALHARSVAREASPPSP